MDAWSLQRLGIQAQEEFKRILYYSSHILDEGIFGMNRLRGTRILNFKFQVMTWWFLTFMAPAIKDKVHSVPGVEYLYNIINMDQLEIPAFITEYDMTVNGVRYVEQTSSDE